MKQSVRAILFVTAAIIFANLFLSGCSAPCTYPNQSGVKVRVVNAMPDESVISIFINGKLFLKDFPYDLQSTFLHDGSPVSFGYYSTYEDGSPLVAGSGVQIVITSDAAGKNVLMKTTTDINFHLQTLMVMGKATDPVTEKVLHLNDDIQASNPNITFMRFVHAVPDLPALDVYWNQPDGSPNITILYGQENPYVDLTNADSLKITEAGKPGKAINRNTLFGALYIPNI